MRSFEIENMYSGFKPFFELHFWPWAVKHPLMTLGMFGLAVLFFFRDLFLLVFLDEEGRDRFTKEV